MASKTQNRYLKSIMKTMIIYQHGWDWGQGGIPVKENLGLPPGMGCVKVLK